MDLRRRERLHLDVQQDHIRVGLDARWHYRKHCDDGKRRTTIDGIERILFQDRKLLALGNPFECSHRCRLAIHTLSRGRATAAQCM